MIIYVRGESVMTFIEWLKDCNEADPLTKKVYICNDYLNAERMLENASGENIVIRLERYTVADHAKHIIETSAEYMDSRIITLSNAEGLIQNRICGLQQKIRFPKNTITHLKIFSRRSLMQNTKKNSKKQALLISIL